MLTKTPRKKKKRHKAQHATKKKTRTTRGVVGPPHPPHTQPTPQWPAQALSLQGEKCVVGQIERYVFRISHITHFCYTSTERLLLLFFCFLATTMPTDDKNQPRYDTPHKPHTARTHTHTHGNHTAHDPCTPPTPTRSATQHTHTHQGEGHPGAHSQEWRAGPHHHNRRTPARSGGEPRPRPSARSGEGPTTALGGKPQPGVAGPRNQTPQPGVARDQPPPHDRGPQPGVAGHSSQVPQPGSPPILAGVRWLRRWPFPRGLVGGFPCCVCLWRGACWCVCCVLVAVVWVSVCLLCVLARVWCVAVCFPGWGLLLV